MDPLNGGAHHPGPHPLEHWVSTQELRERIRMREPHEADALSAAVGQKSGSPDATDHGQAPAPRLVGARGRRIAIGLVDSLALIGVAILVALTFFVFMPIGWLISKRRSDECG